jgi:eukaryotic-like serine/threonine-protein kinase
LALLPGARLGIYEIAAPIGAGGMGEVYRATDTRLNRAVALKFLPDTVAREPERLARFKREAQVLAALNHPHIGAIYGLDDADGQTFLVLELIDGDTLAERIARGPLPVHDVLAIAGQIAAALEVAHEKGIIHRDLKPANVKITSDGKVKVLDFGLAKAMDVEMSGSGTPGGGGRLTHSPTLSLMATEAGMILGTAAYMSPEQAKGFPTDQRTDVFSFGCVLFEMLTGRQAFHADTAAETLAAVLMREPDLATLPVNLDTRVKTLLARCLDKNPKNRWHAIGDVRYEIEAIAARPQSASTAPPTGGAAAAAPPRALWRRALPVLVTAVAVATAAGVAARLTPAPTAPLVRFPIVLPDDQSFTRPGDRDVAISPDGSRLVYVAGGQLYLRALDAMEATPIAGTQLNVDTPFFSPDGKWIGFFSAQELALKKVAVTGGAPVTLCKAQNVNGASWSGNTIAFVQSALGVFRVSADGGEPELIVPVSKVETAHGPQLIDGGKAVLFTVTAEVGPERWDKAQIAVQSIGDANRTVLVRGGSDGYYIAATGHLVYAVGDTLLAVALDITRREVRGGPMPVVEHVTRAPGTAVQSGVAQFAVSSTGVLAYIPNGTGTASGPKTLALADRNGATKRLELPPRAYVHPRLSPDGGQLTVGTDDGKEATVWVYDLKAGGTLRRLTFGGRNLYPIWSADGRWITFQSDRDGAGGMFRQLADGSGGAERLTTSEDRTQQQPESWSPDGLTLSFDFVRGANQGVWTMAMSGDRAPKPFVDSPNTTEKHSAFSPNGRWLAYMASSLRGDLATDVFVESFPAAANGGNKYQISGAEGGRTPAWSRDGRELFYHQQWQNRLIVVNVQTESGFSVRGAATTLPIGGTIHPIAQRNYDVTPDGKQLLVVLPPPTAQGESAKPPAQQINVVVNWLEELKARVPTR